VSAATLAGFDASTPNMARIYNRLLGGKDHFPADRAEAARLLAIYPPLAAMARDNRAFLARAITWAAQHGISQFLDLGAGLPAAPNTHQVARAANADAAVAYVDTDPVVLAHARALLAISDGVAAVAADLCDPAAVLADPELRAVIDPARPAAVILGAVLHFLDAGTARRVTAGYARQAAPGSCLIITVARFEDEALGKQLATEYTAGTFTNHVPDDIASFFAGWDLTSPGLADARTWRPWLPAPVPPRRPGHVLAGIARRP
jgi:O-methyltransferase involved in polyketide biosynthesis